MIDVDGLYRDRDTVRLLKCLCQTEAVKRITWHTLQRQVPREFCTRSKVAILANDWRTLNAHVTGLQDRGHVIVFTPSALEVHRCAATWFWDQEIFDGVGQWLHLLKRPSLRLYVELSELKQAQMPWREVLLSRCLRQCPCLGGGPGIGRPGFANEAARVAAFVARTGGSRSSYFNWKQKLEPIEAVPSLVLPHAERLARTSASG